MQEFIRMYGCPRSMILVHLFRHDRFEISPFNYNEISLIYLYYIINTIVVLSVNSILYYLIVSQIPDLFAIIVIIFASLFLSDFAYDRFLII